jgi:hypothetical protein
VSGGHNNKIMFSWGKNKIEGWWWVEEIILILVWFLFGGDEILTRFWLLSYIGEFGWERRRVYKILNALTKISLL